MKLVKDPHSNNPYLRVGFPHRMAYLRSLSQDYGVPFKVVDTLSSMLGTEEDFDALVSSVNEYSEIHGE
jgi:hypothetical protein